ncbi:MarR family winged helix-turn-helix transcriptional regulator [Streptomyces sp. NPDC007983]|uniref:MarR family winged helix-turn-helix transcriptional regulator n=1 Tax=Streptomyces sp. NPDC007983 TaxID=3364800 RepID=UPI0036EE9ADE
MTTSDAQAAAQWELCKLVDELDLRITAHVRERVARIGLTPAQATALRELTGPMTMSELAGRMSCEPSNATVVIDKLESQQLIERRPHPSDRRAKQLSLTPEGAECREKLLRILREEPPLASLTEQEQGALQDLLRRALSRH